MEIYLLRHGIAEDHAASGIDADRRLTDNGRDELEKVLERACQARVSPAVILTSPHRRALETAEIAARELGFAGHILRSNALLPESSPNDVWDEIRLYRGEPSILLAGHEPLFSQTASHLLGSNRVMIDFPRAALVRIDVETLSVQPAGILQWMLTPKLV